MERVRTSEGEARRARGTTKTFVESLLRLPVGREPIRFFCAAGQCTEDEAVGVYHGFGPNSKPVAYKIGELIFKSETDLRIAGFAATGQRVIVDPQRFPRSC